MGLKSLFNPLGVSIGSSAKIDFELSADSEILNITKSGWYKVICIGAGGAGSYGINSLGYISDWAGGSGAGFVGEVYLQKGQYEVICGAAPSGTSQIGDVIIAGGGGTGTGGAYNIQPVSGKGGILTINAETRNVELQTNGNNGQAAVNGNQGTRTGGASVYNGYGAGGNSRGTRPTAGYVKIYS